MSEEAVDNAPAVDTTTTDAPTETTEARFYDSWSDEYKNDPSLAKFNSPEDIFKSYKEVQKLVGYKGDIPKPDASPEDWNKFYAKLGKPEDTKGYEFKLPEGMEVSENYLPKIAEISHKYNLTKAQAEGLVNDYLAYEQEQIKGVQAQSEQAENERIDAIRNAWGSQAKEMYQAVENMFVKAGLSEEQIQAMEALPADAIIAFGKIAAGLGERGQPGNVYSSTRQGLEDQLGEINAEIQRIVREEKGNFRTPRIDHLLEKRSRISKQLT